ncbi:MAG: hypothetical protein HQK51_07020, partial [Oligoflexia bacterium]|nr:hypothetical protein [Oligoflexia bacterium]
TINKVQILEDRGSKIQLEKITGPAILVLNDNFYPGWQVYDSENNKLEIKPANANFRSVILEKNKSYKLFFEYKPKWYYLGIGLTGLAIITVIVLIFMI